MIYNRPTTLLEAVSKVNIRFTTVKFTKPINFILPTTNIDNSNPVVKVVQAEQNNDIRSDCIQR